eukprot:623-Prorocentrum_minimum.AAC.4
MSCAKSCRLTVKLCVAAHALGVVSNVTSTTSRKIADKEAPRNHFPATNPYKATVPKPRNILRGYPTQDKDDEFVPPEDAKAAFDRAQAAVREVFAHRRNSESERKARIPAKRGDGGTLSVWQKLNLGVSSVAETISPVDALLHNPALATKLIVEQHVDIDLARKQAARSRRPVSAPIGRAAAEPMSNGRISTLRKATTTGTPFFTGSPHSRARLSHIYIIQDPNCHKKTSAKRIRH